MEYNDTELSPDGENRSTSRRKWLKLCGGTAVVGLAGCLGDDDNGNGDDGNGGDDNGNGTGNGTDTNGEDGSVVGDPDQDLSFNGEPQVVEGTMCHQPPGRFNFRIWGVLADGGQDYSLVVAFNRDEDVIDFSEARGAQLQVYVDAGAEIYRDTDQSGQPLVDVSEWGLTADENSLSGTLTLPPVPELRLEQEIFPDGVDISVDITC